MVRVGNIQILCGALADEPASETGQGGIFTRQLLNFLAQSHDPSLLALPFDLKMWQEALPTNLLEGKAVILGDRDVLGERADELHKRSQGVRV